MKTNELEILNKNLKGTNWCNARIENGILVADHHGSLHYTNGSGMCNSYNGITTCRIYPSATLLRKVVDCGFDQKGFVSQNLDFRPL